MIRFHFWCQNLFPLITKFSFSFLLSLLYFNNTEVHPKKSYQGKKIAASTHIGEGIAN